ncbi:MAG: hypothetical protein OXT07_03975 [bacterium]|nr:hypothetical protein [bacterium]
MTDNPNSDTTATSESKEPIAQGETKRKFQGHFHFVISALSCYRINRYEDRKVHPGEIGSGIDSWKEDDHTLAIEEGRRQVGAQYAQLQYVTSRASILLPVGIALSAYLLSALDDLSKLEQPAQSIAHVLLGVGAALAIWGVAVMGALIGGRSALGTIDTALLTEEPAGLREHLARDYAEIVARGEDTNAARLTHLGTGVTCIVVGATLGALGLALSQWGPMQALTVTPS